MLRLPDVGDVVIAVSTGHMVEVIDHLYGAGGRAAFVFCRVLPSGPYPLRQQGAVHVEAVTDDVPYERYWRPAPGAPVEAPSSQVKVVGEPASPGSTARSDRGTRL